VLSFRPFQNSLIGPHYKKYCFWQLLQNVFFAAKNLSMHTIGISAVAKSFAWTINIAVITIVLQQ
jgi:uncharacterized membrane protein